jgi:molybdopterin-guanine dinucleotide biosynthesis protein A
MSTGGGALITGGTVAFEWKVATVHDRASRAVEPVVLAGGESTRFENGEKAFARVGGEPMLGRVLATVAATTDRTPLVAVRDDHQRRAIRARVAESVPFELSFVTDDPAFGGPVAGAVAACEASEAKWLFLTGCDMPLLDREVVSWVLSHCDGRVADAIVPETDGGIEPLHACYRPEAVAAAAEQVSPNAGLRALLDAMAPVTVIDAAACPADLTRSARNVNTVAELERVRANGDATDGMK